MFGTLTNLVVNVAAITLLAARGASEVCTSASTAATSIVKSTKSATAITRSHKSAGSVGPLASCTLPEQRARNHSGTSSEDSHDSYTTHSPSSTVSEPNHPEASSSLTPDPKTPTRIKKRTSDEENASEEYDKFDPSFHSERFTSPLAASNALSTRSPLSKSRSPHSRRSQRRSSTPPVRGSPQRPNKRRPQVSLGPAPTPSSLAFGEPGDFEELDVYVAPSSLFSFEPLYTLPNPYIAESQHETSRSSARLAPSPIESTPSPIEPPATSPLSTSPPFPYSSVWEDSPSSEDEAGGTSDSLITPVLDPSAQLASVDEHDDDDANKHEEQATLDEYGRPVEQSSPAQLVSDNVTYNEDGTPMLTDLPQLYEQAAASQAQRASEAQDRSDAQAQFSAILREHPKYSMYYDEQRALYVAQAQPRSINQHQPDTSNLDNQYRELEEESRLEEEYHNSRPPRVRIHTCRRRYGEPIGSYSATSSQTERDDEACHLALSDSEADDSGCERGSECVNQSNEDDESKTPPEPCECYTDTETYRLIDHSCPTHHGEYPHQEPNVKVVGAAYRAIIYDLYRDDLLLTDYLEAHYAPFFLRRCRDGLVYMLPKVNGINDVWHKPKPLSPGLLGLDNLEALRAVLMRQYDHAIRAAERQHREDNYTSLPSATFSRSVEQDQSGSATASNVTETSTAATTPQVRQVKLHVIRPGFVVIDTSLQGSKAVWLQPRLVPMTSIRAATPAKTDAPHPAPPTDAASIALPDSPIQSASAEPAPSKKSQKRNAARRAKAKAADARIKTIDDETINAARGLVALGASPQSSSQAKLDLASSTSSRATSEPLDQTWAQAEGQASVNLASSSTQPMSEPREQSTAHFASQISPDAQPAPITPQPLNQTAHPGTQIEPDDAPPPTDKKKKNKRRNKGK